MNKIVFINLLLLSVIGYSQSNPFKNLEYDTVIAYEFHRESNRGKDVFGRRKEVIEKKKILTKRQVEKLEAIITSKTSYGGIDMACFIPHFKVMYYLKDKIVAGVLICLECNYLKSSVKIPAIESHTVTNSEGNTYLKKGFSKHAQKRMRSYLTEIGFTKYLPPRDSYLND